MRRFSFFYPSIFLLISALLSFHYGSSCVYGLRHTHTHHQWHETDIIEARLAQPAQSGYTCSKKEPCPNGACCGVSGWCGYGPTYCGKGCQSNCNAKAECGKFAPKAEQSCPLNVCCSEFGFCGTTSEFCGKGCQSNCHQPKPSGPPSNVQKRVVGYWEAWNTQHPCGTMEAGEIPVNYLTHLNVAFGYITPEFQITNMDGLSTDVYEKVGDIKARNPNLKLLIALGGWKFSDPGPWQSVFPVMVSTAANRAVFIKNALRFLENFGYDGLAYNEADWEYPGADDRGGTEKDGENYAALLKELRAAIKASGRDYIVTFTAPTSYWYLRHFDLENMVPHVDWVNLMSYDLHGVWDGNNIIGKQVLAHTNLTEIDLSLDLFWRVGVQPSKIVLGLGFYGRSFSLKDPRCWKPGCAFSGPGDAGPCSGTAGILSLREITDVLRQTGATAYWDKKAAVKYMPYGKNSWISFDDAQTIQAKIDYANRLGLSGLMIWAIDLDNGQLDALRAISDPSIIGNDDTPFDLVDIKNIFPTEYLPPSGYTPKYGLVSFGGSLGSASMDPSNGGFGFFFISGDSHVASPLTKRDNEPDPFEFLDCHGKKMALQSGISKARVACFSDDVEGCFRVMEQGIEGTLVELPDHSYQYIPKTFGGRQPTSQVFDFYFDFNMGLVRRDTNSTSIRIDYSNVKGYWNSVVNSPGIQSRDLKRRFFAPSSVDWQQKYSSDGYSTFGDLKSFDISEDVQAPLLWQAAQGCPASLNRGAFHVHESSGFLHVSGNTNLTYAMGGIGSLDISEAGKGNPAISDEVPLTLGGNTINAGNSADMATFEPFYQIQYEMATMNGTDTRSFGDYGIPFNGRLQARILSDLGDSTLYFPISKTQADMAPIKRHGNKIKVPETNVLYNGLGYGGTITLGSIVTFGLKSKLHLGGQNLPLPIDLPKVIVVTYHASESKLTSFTLAIQQTLDNEQHCYNETNHNLLGGRGKLFGWGYSAGKSINVSDFLKDEAVLTMFDTSQPKFDCDNCVDCKEGRKKPKEDFCCGCVSMQYLYGYTDFNPTIDPPEEGEWIPGHQPRSEEYHLLEKRANGTATLSPKTIKVCGVSKIRSRSAYYYPAFPADATYIWENIDQGRWEPISRYWGNTSASCTNWAAGQLTVADVEYTPAGKYRAKYQTEHVFEGQLISIFFNQWLDKGFFKNQNPMPSNPRPKVPCSFTRNYILKTVSPNSWVLLNKKQPFIQVLLAELGNKRTLDRLTIFKARPNLKKGNVSIYFLCS
ncbi:glycoside hydrolase family 18 protein [Trichoderma sp. TUCIM 5745]